MKSCFHCGGENRDQARFCGHCGKSLTIDPVRRPKPTRKPIRKVVNWVLVIIGVCGVVSFLSQELRSSRQKLEEMGIPCTKEQFLSEAEDGNTKVVELFLSAGMDANSKDIIGKTALAKAVREGRTDTVKVLLDYEADPNIEESYLGGSVLTSAASKGYTEIVQALIDHGAYVNAKKGRWSTRTALQEAKQGGHTDTVKVLQEAGALE